MALICTECGSTEFDHGDPAGWGSCMGCPVSCANEDCDVGGEIRHAHDGSWTEYPDGIATVENHIAEKWTEFNDAVDNAYEATGGSEGHVADAIVAAMNDMDESALGELRVSLAPPTN